MGGRTSCCGGEEQQEVVYHRTVDAELFKLAAGNRRPCNESMCTQLYRDRRPGLGYLCTRGPFRIVSIIANSSSFVHNYWTMHA